MSPALSPRRTEFFKGLLERSYMPRVARRDRPLDLEVNKILWLEGANYNLVGFVVPRASDEVVGEVSNGDDVHRRAAGLLLYECS
jgi:hypothetical protein